MKKFLVLALVLGIASLATAALTVTVSGDATVGGTFYVTLGGVVPTDFATYELYDQYEGYSLGSDYADFTGSYTWTDNGDGFNAAGNLSGSVYYDSTYDGVTWTAGDQDDGTEGDAALNNPVSGSWITFEMVGVAEGTMIIARESDGNYGTPDATIAEVSVGAAVPEPATMALLGLGALVLRRRK